MQPFSRFRVVVVRLLIFFIALVASLYIFRSSTIADDRQADTPQPVGAALPTGKTITPTAATGAIFQDLDPQFPTAPERRANQASAVSVSPDGKILAILTSGENQYYGPNGKPVPGMSTEHVFLFDITRPRPQQLQVLVVPNSFQGLAWTPTSDKLFVSGGEDDDVLEFVRNESTFVVGRTFRLGHNAGLGIAGVSVHDPLWGNVVNTKPAVGALAVSPDGAWLLAANFQNDSVTLIEVNSGRVVAEQDLRPGIIDPKRRGQPGGSYPRSVVWTTADHAYVASERDREIISLAVSRQKLRVLRRVLVHGQPVALLANRKGSRLYAALDNTDRVVVFDTARDTLVEDLSVVAPEAVYRNAKKLGGANANALALTPDEGTLLVSDGGENAIAVVRLSDRARGSAAGDGKARSRQDRGDEAKHSDRSAVIGLVPTGWYPTGVAVSKDGATWYAVNAKSPTGPNVSWCHKLDPSRNVCLSDLPHPPPTDPNWDPPPNPLWNGYSVLIPNNMLDSGIERAGFLTLPAPSALELARLTKQVAHNNHFDAPEMDAKDEQLFAFLRQHIHHVIYAIKENRTYDQILGDLGVGNGDPRFAFFTEDISPNHHAIARGFVTLDNFLLSGEGSSVGWDWSTAARTSDFREHQERMNVRAEFDGYMWGANRHINMGYATSSERHAERAISPSDPDILPGARDVGELDGPGGEPGKGYIWDAALRRGLTVRSYGFYELPDSSQPLVREPYAEKIRVFFPTIPTLIPFSDPYYRGWDPAYPDYWRYREWKREFDAFSASGSAPNLMLLQLGNDHTGCFDHAIDGVNTPETQMADNDYALGLIIEAVANSPFANDTLIVAVEDDPSDGPDHVDAFRSVALLAGPYVHQHDVVSTRYTTVNLVKTIEEILGVGPIGLNDALAAPMSDAFDPNAANWTYKAIVPDVLYSTKLPLPPTDHPSVVAPRHDASYWTRVMAGQDFSGPDRVNPATFNRALWRGLKGNQPYPPTATESDPTEYRAQLSAKRRVGR